MKSIFNRSTAAVVAAALAYGVGANALAQAPAYPAAPLAGGQAAYQGGSYENAYGEQIVMPASYCQPGAGYGEMCAPDGCGYGDQGQFAALVELMKAGDKALTDASRAEVERQKASRSPLAPPH